ncbi:sulfurtransferase [Aquincola tertiaricarbonis]|uniref:sulfurtransferase n=1 Tax=Aquincola tertiaricarbonis TaxID=391953 RepID=UPI000614C520|nr:sulfurtransferase [Aquincola tertiaricarbonis]
MNLPRPLISAPALRELLSSGQPVVLLDCGFDLTDASAGERAHAAGHLPGALYVHLDRDLSGDKSAGPAQGGRHPLPTREALAATVGRWGIRPGVPVVAYDAQGGPYAARAWWLLRWLGHAEVAVLDGGPAAWQAAGGSLTDAPSQAQAQPPYPASAQPALPTIDAPTLLRGLGQVRLFDARAAERFRGEVEPLDAKAGHIPGARNRFFKDNLGADGRFKPAEVLRAEWQALLGGAATQQVVQQCGSGVTACHNLLALAHAGLGDATLYPGSWSEWSADAARPVATGS